jgi:hypothetical protein
MLPRCTEPQTSNLAKLLLLLLSSSLSMFPLHTSLPVVLVGDETPNYQFSHHSVLSPLSSLTTLFSHHSVLSPLCSLATQFSHHSVLSPLCSLTTQFSHHSVLSPLSSLTTQFSHHSVLSPLCSLTTQFSHHSVLSPLSSTQLLISLLHYATFTIQNAKAHATL